MPWSLILNVIFWFRLKLIGMMDREYLRAQCQETSTAARTTVTHYIPPETLKEAIKPLTNEIYQVSIQLHCFLPWTIMRISLGCLRAMFEIHQWLLILTELTFHFQLYGVIIDKISLPGDVEIPSEGEVMGGLDANTTWIIAACIVSVVLIIIIITITACCIRSHSRTYQNADKQR